MNRGRISIVQGDITRQQVDAIVNAANSSLRGGGGVDGAIHRVAGPELLQACIAIGGCPTGEARITPGFRFPARWIIHTVGPVWHGGDHGEPELLANCYRNSMALAARPDYGIKTIAFPSISTGAYGYPVHLAAYIAIDEIDRAFAHGTSIQHVTFVCFNNDAFREYERAAQALLD